MNEVSLSKSIEWNLHGLKSGKYGGRYSKECTPGVLEIVFSIHPQEHEVRD